MPGALIAATGKGKSATKLLLVAGLVLIVLQGHWLPALFAGCVAILVGPIIPGAWMALGPLMIIAVLSPFWSDVPLLSNVGAASWWTCGVLAAASSSWFGRPQGRQVFRWTMVLLLWCASVWTLGSGLSWMLEWPLTYGWSSPVFPARFRPFGFHGATQLGALIAMCFVATDAPLSRLRSKVGRILSICSRCVAVMSLVWVDSRAAWLAIIAVGLLQGGRRTRGLLLAGFLGCSFSALLEWLPVIGVSSRGSRLGILEHLLPLSPYLAPMTGNFLRRQPWVRGVFSVGIIGFSFALPVVVHFIGQTQNALQSVATGRVLFWEAAWRGAAESPIYGAGAWSYTRAYLDAYGLTSSFVPMHAHNLALQVLVDFGVIGGLGIVLAIGAIWWLGRGRVRNPATAALLALWVQSSTDVPGSEVLWLAGMVVGVVGARKSFGGASRSRLWGMALVCGSIWVGGRALFPLEAETRMLRGSLAWQSGRPEEAERIWMSGVVGSAEASRAALLSRYARANTGPVWISEAARVAEAAPWHPLLALSRIHVWRELGLDSRADSLLAVQISRWPTVQVYWLAYLRYSQLGDTLRARQSLIAAIRLDPSVAGLGGLPFSVFVVDSLLQSSEPFRWSESSLSRLEQGDTLVAVRACRIARLALTIEPIGPPLKCLQVLGAAPGSAMAGNQPIRHSSALHELYAYGATTPPALTNMCWERVRYSVFAKF